MELGKQMQRNILKSNPLKQQEVRHTYYQREHNSFAPLVTYIYDGYGTMTNTRRKLKKPTVKNFITKANEDLENQIRN